ncbi:MAG: SPOR domain-containing protein [Rhodocyclaceae bacterium]
MPEVLQQAREEDELRRSRQHMMIKIALAAAVALIVILALILSESSTTTEPAPTAQVVKPITAAPRADNPPAESLEEAARRALKTSEEAAQIQSAVLADQKTMPQAASAVPEETTDPTALGVPASAPTAARAESSGRLVLGQTSKRTSSSAPAAKPQPAPEPVTRGVGPVAPAVAAAVSGQGSSKAQAAHSAPATSSATHSTVATPPAFLVQAGVFANYSNAEELRNKLVAAGIPAQIESRVQIGPFANKQEAAAAQQKLRALGLDGGMLVPRTTGKP